jgi:hypothetical protein
MLPLLYPVGASILRIFTDLISQSCHVGLANQIGTKLANVQVRSLNPVQQLGSEQGKWFSSVYPQFLI